MAAVDLAQPARSPWGYWIPEPALMLRPETQERRDRYLITWLRLRPSWLYLLRRPDARVTRVPTQWWRNILYGPTGRTAPEQPTRNSQIQDAILEVFGDIFSKTDYDSGATSYITWFGFSLSFVKSCMVPLVIWEMFELGFRYELLALDRYLVPLRQGSFGEEERDELLSRVFGGDLYCLSDLPDEPLGLCSPYPHRRAAAIEGFRRIISRWPGCPETIHGAIPVSTAMSEREITEIETILVRFYVNRFFAESGRAPIIPHAFPHELYRSIHDSRQMLHGTDDDDEDDV